MNNSYLAHYGVLGMKLGVRRYQNKDGTRTFEGKKRYSRSELKQLSKERMKYESDRYEIHADNDPRNEEIKQLKKKANFISRNYNFDPDDGGNAITKKDKIAAKKYMEIWDKIEQLEIDLEYDAESKAANDVLQKYGKETVKEIDRYDTSVALGTLAAIMAIPVAAYAVSKTIH